jgi:hypothetical protein
VAENKEQTFLTTALTGQENAEDTEGTEVERGKTRDRDE